MSKEEKPKSKISKKAKSTSGFSIPFFNKKSKVSRSADENIEYQRRTSSAGTEQEFEATSKKSGALRKAIDNIEPEAQSAPVN